MNTLLRQIHEDLGITTEHLQANRLLLCEEPPLHDLEIVAIDFEGKPFVLKSATAKAWREMAAVALADGITLQPFSGFRSYLHQKRLIERHLTNGRDLKDILTHIAIPGYSEHHSGRAIDIYSDNHSVLEEEFEKTPAFAWLIKNAGRFHFRLSYPRDNSFGIIYEPWHWYFTA
jgi:D-alanyl-D-alanine carboxypeptidase